MLCSDIIAHLSEIHKRLSNGEDPPRGVFDDLLSRVIELRVVQAIRSCESTEEPPCKKPRATDTESRGDDSALMEVLDKAIGSNRQLRDFTITFPPKKNKKENELLAKYFGIKNNRVHGDTHSLPKALALGQLRYARTQAKTAAEKRQITQTLENLTRASTSVEAREKAQLQLAKKLLTDAQMPTDQEEHDRDDLEKLCAHLSDYQVHLWNGNAPPSVHEIFNPSAKKFIGIFYHNNHYEYVSTVKVPRLCSFCHKCNKFENGNNHYKTCGVGLLRDFQNNDIATLTEQLPTGSQLAKVIKMGPRVYGVKITNADGTTTYSMKVKGNKKIPFEICSLFSVPTDNIDGCRSSY